MELKLPLVVTPLGGRLVEAWVPAFWPSLRKTGPSLSALRDELALAVMERFESEDASEAAAYQFPPHLSLKHVKVDTEAKDRDKGLRVTVKGRMAVDHQVRRRCGADHVPSLTARTPLPQTIVL